MTVPTATPAVGTKSTLTVPGVTAVLAVIGLAIFAAVTGSTWFVLLAGAGAGLGIAAVATRAQLDGLAVEVEHVPRVTVGGVLASRVTVVNHGARASSATRLCLHTRGLADVVFSVGSLRPGDRTSLVVERPALGRAVSESTLGHLVARTSLGLLVRARDVVVADQVIVHPVLSDHVARAVTSGVIDDLSSDVVIATTGAEVLGVREWRPGDDPGRVHWRTTARSGRLTRLERGDVESAQLRLALVGSDRQPGFESALSVAATICDAALAEGTAVAVVAWHVDGPVLATTGSRWELLDWWSTVHDTVLPDPPEFGRMARAGFGPGDLLVVGPPDTDEGWLSVAAVHCAGLRLLPVPVPS